MSEFLQRSLHLFSDCDQNLVGGTIQQMRDLVHLSLDPITLLINTNGGDVLHAFALIAAMKHCPAPIHTLALGRCFSAGLLVYLAGTRRLAYPCTMFMSHDFISGNGPYQRMRKLGDWLDQRIVEHFVRYTHLSADIIKERLMGAEFYFDEVEAQAMGMVDEILGAQAGAETIS